MTSQHPTLILVFLAASVHSSGLAALQAPVRIAGPPDCADCSLEMVLEVTLGGLPDLDGPVVGYTSSVVRDSTGRIILTHNLDPTSIHVFDSDGTFIRSLGSRAKFSFVAGLVLGDEGNLYAFDRSRETMTMFSPDFETLETRRVPFRVRKALSVRDGFVVAAYSYSEDLIGIPLHLLTRDLKVARSFGTTHETGRPDMLILQFRSITKSADGLIWATAYNNYLIEEWDPYSGTRRRAFERDVGWFDPWYVDRDVSLDFPPNPRLMGAWQDDDGLLWSLVMVGAEAWGEGIDASRGNGDLRVLDSQRLYDTYIEVIDPTTGRLLMSERVPQSLMGFTNDGLMIGPRHPEEDVRYVDLWRAKLIR